jgi:hypothetical protein
MRETSTHNYHIKSHKDLKEHQNQLKHTYDILGNGIKQQTIPSISNVLLRAVKRTFSSDSEFKVEKQKPANLTIVLASQLAKKIVPKKWGWLEK